MSRDQLVCDSTLVQALTKGYSVVVEEIDKTSNETKAMVKARAADRILTLADGRKMGRGKFYGKSDGYACRFCILRFELLLCLIYN